MECNKIKCHITRNGILIETNALRKALGSKYNSLLKKLTIKHVKKIGFNRYETVMELYRIITAPNGKNYLCVSRFSDIMNIFSELHINENTDIKFTNIIKDGLLINIDDEIDLEEHQELCLDYLMQHIYNDLNVKRGLASCIFVMDTGLGKTFTAAGLIQRLKTKTLVIIPNKSNLDGWYDPFKIYLKNVKLGEYHSDKKMDGDVVIMTIDSALTDDFIFIEGKGKDKKILKMSSYQYFSKFGLVIYDEIHNYPTKKQSEIFWRTCFNYGLGLTATPDERMDKMDIVYYKHVGPVINAKEIPGFSDLSEDLKWNGLVKCIEYHGPKEYTERITNSLGWTDTTEMQKQYAKDPYRTKMIIDICLEKIKENRNVFIFALHCDFLDIIYDFLIKVSQKDKIIQFRGGATEETQKIAKNIAQIILTTYSFGKESVSIKRMDTIILAQPMRNRMRQTIGRILRRGGDASITREIIDIRDMCTSLENQFTTRKKIYKEKEFPIEVKVIKYNDINIDNGGSINQE